ncbi:ty3-gypsy retrotransposon protein [Cucumis melo var. makuwa]|uniref:Ty3-gypsy retrotransposon protein n=1 Tax=Cucumis melo var. makuwa TaxID=1194695 RepID=A0A5A7TCA9_CUCMM|nr:ty3-gypsy retrotransposon protein [Cucumis melo var. makuwa]
MGHLYLLSLSHHPNLQQTNDTKEKATSKSSVASNAYTGPVTRSRLKGIIQKQDQGSIIMQNILKQLMKSFKVGIVIKENPLYDNSNSASSKSKKGSTPLHQKFCL